MSTEGKSEYERTMAWFWRGVRFWTVCVVLIVVGIFLVRWAAAEYYITTHCTTVLGTRVCR